ncbi:MAG: hypothetical protein CO175_02030 [Verrucomicrobia bacterium CG_4_9_14_3_um_filter_43_20]|nr:MAG: hypothetical protein COY94_00925 [Verrucomicrobia bacterium CG_4_10_14_0_8_um_filter_43_34]PJA44610.1 MAG: hypothetical protein CO175_02030 [Verrucomicrobia bacterium CG_4_9_14_3_um_filter_43_20]
MKIFKTFTPWLLLSITALLPHKGIALDFQKPVNVTHLSTDTRINVHVHHQDLYEGYQSEIISMTMIIGYTTKLETERITILSKKVEPNGIPIPELSARPLTQISFISLKGSIKLNYRTYWMHFFHGIKHYEKTLPIDINMNVTSQSGSPRKFDGGNYHIILHLDQASAIKWIDINITEKEVRRLP